MPEKQYLCIDQKSFYATVECVARGLDPLKTNLVVADPDRSQNTICLAITPSMKALGVKNRCRIRDIPPNIQYIVAPPRMQLYIDCTAAIHGVFLRYVAPEDIYTYSIDESFIDVTPYLKLYQKSARELAKDIIQSVYEVVGTVSVCGIGTNMYLAKIALDILAKHAPDFIAELDENSYQQMLWDHTPLTDFWRIGPGTAKRLRNHGITTMRGIKDCNEDLLYRWFGIDAELLIDHAWGREPTTIADIKGYKTKSKSLSSSQVLMRNYSNKEAEIIVKEMMDQLCLDMAAKHIITDSVSLYVGHSHTQGVLGIGGTVKLPSETNVAAVIVPAVVSLYQRITNPEYMIRRIGLSCNNVINDTAELQLNIFEDTNRQIKHKALQEAMLEIRAKYGKNSILKGINLKRQQQDRSATLRLEDTVVAKMTIRTPMPASMRAKQFMMFDAMKGLTEAIAAKERSICSQIILSEERINEINNQLLSLENGQLVSVTYYDDFEKDSLQLSGTIQKIEPYWKYVQINSTIIYFTKILIIEPITA